MPTAAFDLGGGAAQARIEHLEAATVEHVDLEVRPRSAVHQSASCSLDDCTWPAGGALDASRDVPNVCCPVKLSQSLVKACHPFAITLQERGATLGNQSDTSFFCIALPLLRRL